MDRLLKILRELHPEVDFYDIVALITEIQDEFDVTIDARKILPQNFNSAKALYALIQEMEGI